MKFLSTALLAASLCAAPALRAGLEYLVYNLTDQTVAEIDSPSEPELRSDFHDTDTMLFVRNPAISDYYIGVFEVTAGQAKTLGWQSTASTTDTEAFANPITGNFPSIDHETHPQLSFPTAEQWTAYATNADGTLPEILKPCNVHGGRNSSLSPGPFLLSTWYSTYLVENFGTQLNGQPDYAQANSNGVFDLFGNVAEYTVGGDFYGGFANGTCTYDSLIDPETQTITSVTEKTIDETIKDIRCFGARLIYTPKEHQRFSVVVKLDGTVVKEERYAPGTENVTVTPPDPLPGYRLTDGCTITPASITAIPFTMPSETVTVSYTSRPYLLLSAEGGTASKSEVFEGETVTLTPDAAAYRLFEAWHAPEGLKSSIDSSVSDDGNLTLTVQKINAAEAGATLIYTASFTTAPRVMVYGGSVSAVANGRALGEGYYTPGTSLTLKAGDVEGYAFRSWTLKTEGDTRLSGTKVTVGSSNTRAELTPNYDVDSSGSLSNPEVTRIGETEIAEGKYAARTVLGYTAGSVTTRSPDGNNRFEYYATEACDADDNYVSLDLQNGALEYNSTASGNSKTTALTLKRMALTGEQPYYVGIYETTVAHCGMLEILQREQALAEQETSEETEAEREALQKEKAKLLAAISAEENAEESAGFYLKPQLYLIGETGETHTQCFEILEKFFGVELSLPTVAQIEGITKAGLTADETFSGAGFYNVALNNGYGYGDTKITDEMINLLPGAYTPDCVGKMKHDPYGFYDLWGNAFEMIADGTLRGGARHSPIGYCNLSDESVDGRFTAPANSFYGAFRPAATVPKKFSVTIAGIDESFDVLPNQVIQLAPQVKAGKTFTGWQAAVDGTATDIEKAGDCYPYTVTADVTLTPIYSDEAPMITLTYENCTGPEKALPGSTTAVYATTPGYELRSLNLSPETAGKVNEDNTITFDAAATGAVTVTATYDIPEPAKPGYRFSLR